MNAVWRRCSRTGLAMLVSAGPNSTQVVNREVPAGMRAFFATPLVFLALATSVHADALFSAPFLSYDVGFNPSSVAIADLGSQTVSVLLGNGDGTFGTKFDFGTGNEPVSVGIADFNADGRPDVVAVNRNDNTLAVLLGQGSTVDVPRDLPRVQGVSNVIPNPTRNRAYVRLELPTRARIRASVYDMAGRLVREIGRGHFEAGVHTLTWDGTGNRVGHVAPGLYFFRISVEGLECNRTIVKIQ